MGRGKGIPAICIDCHTADVMKGAFVHRPITEGKCGSCHDLHTSDHPSLLKADGPSLCRPCHAAAFRQPVVHPPVAAGECTACHDPHAAGSRHLLKAFSSDLCLRCHVPSRFDGISVHKPVDDGDCGVCHLPHGSAHPRLLAKAYPTERYLPFSEERFALCFECHDPALVTDQLTLSSTRFRNGDQNLHHRHVMLNQRGRSCSACHDVHASPQQHLVTTQVTGFGSWAIPIAYTVTDTGGTCVVGCHKPKSYDRVVYVENNR